MKITRESATSLTIRSVSTGAITVGGRSYAGTIALTTDRVIEDVDAPSVAQLDVGHFAELLRGDPELVVIGTGSRGLFPPRELTFAFARRGIGLEVMDTAAAARTFNVLAGEGRRLAALLYVD